LTRKLIKAFSILESIQEVLILNERNVANPKDIENYIESCLKYYDYASSLTPEIESWFRTTVRKYLINEYVGIGVRLLNEKPHRSSLFYQSWMEKAFESGDPVYFWAYGDENDLHLTHILDFLTYIADNPDEVPRNLRLSNLSHLSYQTVLEKSNDWTYWLNTKNIDNKDADEGETLFARLKNGYTAVKVFGKEALTREGSLMQHCVGSYADRVSRRTEIFSIRDAQGKPHITIEYKDGVVNQFQGKQNTVPLEKYWDALLEFFNILKPKEIRGLHTIGDPIFFEGNFYKTEDDLPNHYWKSDKASERFLNRVLTVANVEKTKYYLKKGINPNKVVHLERIGYMDALSWAVRSALYCNKFPEIILLLIEHGANVEGSLRNESPLSIAVDHEDLEIAKILLDAGAKVENLSVRYLIGGNSPCSQQMKDLLMSYKKK
jgi:hypothetical protein